MARVRSRAVANLLDVVWYVTEAPFPTALVTIPQSPLKAWVLLRNTVDRMFLRTQKGEDYGHLAEPHRTMSIHQALHPLCLQAAINTRPISL